MASAQAPLALRGRRVIRELRELRDARGWTLDEAAQASGLSAATISRTESGDGLRPPNVSALLDAYGVGESDRQRLMSLARYARRQGWAAGVDDAVMSPPYKDLAELEAEAGWKRSFEPLMVPGLLQTPGYGSLALAATDPQLTPDQRSEKLDIRLKRQERLGPLVFFPIILEEVLRRPVGGTGVMREQVEHLIETTSSQAVNLRVLSVSVGMHPGIMGAFTFLGDFASFDAVIAYIETASGEACYEDEATVAAFQARYERLESLALDAKASLALMKKVHKELR